MGMEDIANLTREIVVLRGRAIHVRDLAKLIFDDKAREGLIAHAAEIDQRVSDFEGRVAALKAEASGP